MSPTPRPNPPPVRTDAFPWIEVLRAVLVVDALILLSLGSVMFFAPERALDLFHFENLPGGVHYIVGLLGAVLLSLAFGYAVAATNPLRHEVWVQTGILRGALEVALGFVALVRGWVTWDQARFGLGVAAVLVVTYVVVYPRRGHAGTPQDDRELNRRSDLIAPP